MVARFNCMDCDNFGDCGCDKPDLNNDISCENTLVLKAPKIIARVKICGALTFQITDNIDFEMPTEEQRENLKKTFGIEVELVEEE